MSWERSYFIERCQKRLKIEIEKVYQILEMRQNYDHVLITIYWLYNIYIYCNGPDKKSNTGTKIKMKKIFKFLAIVVVLIIIGLAIALFDFLRCSQYDDDLLFLIIVTILFVSVILFFGLILYMCYYIIYKESKQS